MLSQLNSKPLICIHFQAALHPFQDDFTIKNLLLDCLGNVIWGGVESLTKFTIYHIYHFLSTWQFLPCYRNDTIYTWQIHMVYFYHLIILYRFINGQILFPLGYQSQVDWSIILSDFFFPSLWFFPQVFTGNFNQVLLD